MLSEQRTVSPIVQELVIPSISETNPKMDKKKKRKKKKKNSYKALMKSFMTGSNRTDEERKEQNKMKLKKDLRDARFSKMPERL